MGFNTYGSKQRKYGGSRPVWFVVYEQERCGGTLENLPPVGTVIPAGTLVSLDRAGGTAKIIPTFEVAANVSTSDVTAKVKVIPGLSVPENNMNLMKAPDSINGSGKSGAISEVINNEDGTYSFTITAGSLGALSAGDVLIMADKAAASGKVYAIPTGLTFNDVYIEEGDDSATVASVYHGEIMEDRIQPIPESVKAALPQIKFVKGV